MISPLEIDTNCGSHLPEHALSLGERRSQKRLALQERILKDLGVAKKRKKKGDSGDSGEKEDEASGRIDMRRF